MSKKLIFFGAGEVCRFSLQYAVLRQLEVAYIVDNNSEKWGTVFKNVPVISPDELQVVMGKSEKSSQKKYEIIITVGAKALDEISMQLQTMGFLYGRDFITCHDKFYSGKLPGSMHPGYDYDKNPYHDFTLLKPITDCALYIDKKRKNVYRAVDKEKAENLRLVYERINSNETLMEYVIETLIVENTELNKKYPLVFKHHYWPVTSYPSEWPPKMYRDYVLFMMDFLKELDKAGLGLQDPSLLNAAFHNGRFIYMDFSGIYWDKTNWFIMHTLLDLHVNTLIMIIKSQAKGYLYLKNPSLIVKYADIAGYLNENEKKQYWDVFQNCEKLVSAGDIQKGCVLVKEYIQLLSAGFKSLSDWTGYQDNLFLKYQNKEKYTRKQKEVIDLVRRTSPKSVLDLAGNMGWYSIALSKELDYAITLDIDSGISDCAYETVQKTGCKNVYPICLNFIGPTPAAYRNLYLCTDSIHPNRKGGIERFQCDTVLALAVIHHLALTQGLSFPEIIGQMYLYTKKYLIIEFVDRGDEYVIQYLRQYSDEMTAWYTKDRFEQAVIEKYEIITTRPSTENRTLYLCERR